MRQLLMIFTAMCGLFATPIWAATNTTLEVQMFSLAMEVQEALKSDPRLAGQTLSMGKFDGEGDAESSNFGERITDLLRNHLASVLTSKGKFILAGSYHYVTSEDPATPDAKVLVVTAQIKTERGKEILPISVEINNTDNIYQALGLTGTTSPNATFARRNEAAQDAHKNPTFDTKGTHVTAKGAPQWTMGILKKSTFNGPTSPVPPLNVNGLAFTSVGIGEYYEIELANNDAFDSVATVTVDGLDVANTFTTDKDQSGKAIHWPGYYIPAGQSIVIRGWLNTIDQSVKNNVFSFRVDELGQGAATALKTRGRVGVITVQFRDASERGKPLRGRNVKGETAKGEGLQEKLESKPIQIGDHVLSTISIRYNRPE